LCASRPRVKKQRTRFFKLRGDYENALPGGAYEPRGLWRLRRLCLFSYRSSTGGTRCCYEYSWMQLPGNSVAGWLHSV